MPRFACRLPAAFALVSGMSITTAEKEKSVQTRRFINPLLYRAAPATRCTVSPFLVLLLLLLLLSLSLSLALSPLSTRCANAYKAGGTRSVCSASIVGALPQRVSSCLSSSDSSSSCSSASSRYASLRSLLSLVCSRHSRAYLSHDL